MHRDHWAIPKPARGNHRVRPSETDRRSLVIRVSRTADAEDALPIARWRAQGRCGRGSGGVTRRLRSSGRSADRGGGRRISDRHSHRAARVGTKAVPRADDAEAFGAGARDAGGDRLQAADYRTRDRRNPRREQQRRRPLDARRATSDQDGGSQAGRRTAVHVRHDAGVSRTVRPERHHRSSEGRGDGGCARLRAADRARRVRHGTRGAAVRRCAGNRKKKCRWALPTIRDKTVH